MNCVVGKCCVVLGVVMLQILYFVRGVFPYDFIFFSLAFAIVLVFMLIPVRFHVLACLYLSACLCLQVSVSSHVCLCIFVRVHTFYFQFLCISVFLSVWFFVLTCLSMQSLLRVF